MNALTQTNYKFSHQTSVYKGKVRDVYGIDNKYLVMIASDRISAFDVVMPKGIPYKGQVLNQIATSFLHATKDIVPNWILDVPDPVVSIGKLCTPFKVEMVVRGYLAGHAARIYNTGGRSICGVSLPDGLKENDKLPQPIITPTTKASVGHDEDISKQAILKKGIVSAEHYEQLENYTLKLYERGQQMAHAKGLILVDTKYEFGLFNGEIHLMDEIHTPDSSRYFYLDGYEERQKLGQEQKQLSKEFVRKWLIQNGFQGKEEQQVPQFTTEFINEISERYIELYEKILGTKFVKSDLTQIKERIHTNVESSLKSLV